MRKTPVDMWSNAQTRNRLYVIISMQQNDTRYVMGMHTIKYNRWCVLRKYKSTLDKDQWKDRDKMSMYINKAGGMLYKQWQ